MRRHETGNNPSPTSELPVVDPKPDIQFPEAVLQAAATIYASNRVQTYEAAVQHAIELQACILARLAPPTP